MDSINRYVIEFEDGSFALWGQFVEGEIQGSILSVDKFYIASFFKKEQAQYLMESVNKGSWKFLGDSKIAKCIRLVEMKLS